MNVKKKKLNVFICSENPQALADTQPLLRIQERKREREREILIDLLI